MNDHKTIRIAAASMAAGVIFFATTPTQAQCSPEEVTKLTAPDAAFRDYFGASVAVSGDTAIIGATGDDDGGTESGSAYIFRSVGGVWQQIAKLTADDAQEFAHFGHVAIDGKTAIVGATGNGFVDASGAAYVFREIDGVWQQIVRLTAADATSFNAFGFRVALSGGIAIIGAPSDEENGYLSGAAYIFGEVDGSWLQLAKLTADDALPLDQFGGSVAISGETALIGALRSSSFGDGRAYVFRKVGGDWQQTAKLTPADSSTLAFGWSVALDGDTAVIGAIGPMQVYIGAAYIFRETGGVWQEIAKLTHENAAPYAYFGYNVALSNGTVVIGSSKPTYDESFLGSGATYVYREIANDWPLTATLNVSGYSIAVDGNTSIIGNPADFEGGSLSGAAHVYDLHCTPAGDCNTNGIPDEDELEGNDCNSDGVPDECPIAGNDCNSDGVPDDCQLEGNDCDTNGILDACEPHGIAQARSCLEHGAAGEFCLTIQGDVIEPRLAGLSILEMELTNIGCGLVVDVAVDCVVNPYMGMATVTQEADNALRVAFDPALPDEDCCEIALSGSVEGNWQVRTLAGNVDGDQLDVVSFGDISVIKPHLGQTADPDNFLLDFDANGYINGADITAIKPRIGNAAVACP